MAIKPILFNTEMVRAILDGIPPSRNPTLNAMDGMRILTFS